MSPSSEGTLGCKGLTPRPEAERNDDEPPNCWSPEIIEPPCERASLPDSVRSPAFTEEEKTTKKCTDNESRDDSRIEIIF